jgi:hypothetical protein
MSLWEFACYVEGWNEAQGGGGDDGEGMTVEQLQKMNPPATIH